MKDGLIILITILVLGGFLCFCIWVIYKFIESERKIKARKESEWKEKVRLFKNAQSKYFNSLHELKNYPTNPNLKQQTLFLGREYASITREFQGMEGITLYDEVALMNDINAACAGATAISARTTNSSTVGLRLAKLSELKERSLISEEEYKARRQRILDEI